MLATLIASRSNLGYARNWDLIALFVPALTVSAMLRLREALSAPAFRRTAIVLGTVSAVHTASWVLVFAREQASLERFAALPLEGGQAESTIGFWHALRGRPAEAKSWLDKKCETTARVCRAVVSIERERRL